MLFSIIIPVYNVEEYVSRCLKSVLEQEFCDYEVILVDDGSTDNSLVICEKYSVDERVKLFSKPNGGLSSTRNFGLDHARGDYILFLDSDDYIEKGSLARLACVIQQYKSDVFIIKARTIYDDNTFFDEHKEMKVIEYSRDEYLDYLTESGRYSACSPYMVYKREFIDSNNFRFYDKILHEDELWTPNVILSANTICTSNVLVYYHFLRKGSITQSRNYVKRGESLIVVLEELLKSSEFCNNPHAIILRNQWAFLFLETVVFLNASEKITQKFPKKYLLQFAQKRKLKNKAKLYCVSPRLYLTVRNKVKGRL